MKIRDMETVLYVETHVGRQLGEVVEETKKMPSKTFEFYWKQNLLGEQQQLKLKWKNNAAAAGRERERESKT